MDQQKIPIVIGVTGHRNIDDNDKSDLMREVTAAINEIKAICAGKNAEQDTPIVMLNALAEGADMLCAEVAFDMGIDVYAVLPCSKEDYAKSFTNNKDRARLNNCINKAKRVMIAPDVEKNEEWLEKESGMSASDYQYRQTGIYIAEHSHILLALWDGKPSGKQFGCGTAEVINFALEHKFFDEDRLFDPGILNDSAVLWINARRAGGEWQDIKCRWLVGFLSDEPGAEAYNDYYICKAIPEYLLNIIKKTAKYNSEEYAPDKLHVALWANESELGEYHKSIDHHYAKADNISFNKNQRYYNLFILLIAIIGTFVAFSFMLYDDAALTFMIVPCALAVGILLYLIRRGNKREYQSNYIEYRAFAEACRIQFYMSLCLKEKPILTNVCRLYSWTQKFDFAWIYKALQSLAVLNEVSGSSVDTAAVMAVWIGDGSKPKGQHKYHSEKLIENKKRAQKYERFIKFLNIVTIAIYAVIFILEVTNHILNVCGIGWFWDGDLLGIIAWRSVGIIVMGTTTAASLLFTSYFGKLSFGRKADDNKKMRMFYASAYARWKKVESSQTANRNKFFKEIAREEIVENGIWCSYVMDNSLEINI